MASKKLFQTLLNFLFRKFGRENSSLRSLNNLAASAMNFTAINPQRKHLVFNFPWKHESRDFRLIRTLSAAGVYGERLVANSLLAIVSTIYMKAFEQIKFVIQKSHFRKGKHQQTDWRSKAQNYPSQEDLLHMQKVCKRSTLDEDLSQFPLTETQSWGSRVTQRFISQWFLPK